MYEFKEQDAWDFARQQGIEANQKGDQLHFKICPYCRPRNLKGNSNTFSISLRTGQFKCLRSSCGVTGNMVTLSRDFDFSLGSAVDEYYRPKKQYRRLPTPKVPIIPKDPAIAYLASRGISEEVARKYEITTNNGQDNILAFPFYDDKGLLQFVKYRKTDFDKEKDKNKEWCEARCRPILFGMKQCNPENKTLVLTEGQCFDGKAELLTPDGWISFENYSGQDVLQVDEKMEGIFVRPISYIIKRHIGKMVRCEIGGNYETYTTDDHKIVLVTEKGKVIKKSAIEKISTIYRIPTVVNVDGVGYAHWTNDMFALYLAVSADGTIDIRKNTGWKKAKIDKYVRMAVALERKSKRLRKILDSLNIEYSCNKESRGYDSICFPCPQWLKSKYLPYGFATGTTVEQKKFIIEEMVHWDGNKVKGRNQYEYTSVIKHNADVMQLIASTCGYMSTIMTKQNGGNRNFVKSYCYKVSVLLKKGYVTTQQFEKNKEIKDVDQRVYCVTVESGMILVRQNGKISVSGNCDSLAVATAGIENAVSVPNGAKGFTWVPYCYNWIRQFDEIIVFGDYENGEISLLEEMRKRFPNKIRHVREQDYKGCKDANEILLKHGKEAVRLAVENAEQVQIRNVIPLAQVKPVNVYELEKLETGITELDLKLFGGLPFGAVCILTGKRGDGKSTFGSQIMANAIQKGYKTFAYSGEMTNAHYQNCFDLQIAGAHHITENNRNGIISRFITKKNLELIHAWYEEKAFIYDSRIVENDEREELLATITHTIQQYGVRVILLDNLMTAMYEDEGKYRDKYDQQGKFVRELARIALKFEVLIILISHRRKNAFSTDVNDEISGSGDISNLASVTLSYDRPSKEEVAKGHAEAGQRRLILAKNRLFGKLDLDGMLLDYDEKSRRIYGKMDDVNKRFGWDNSDGFVQINMETPWGQKE